MVRWTGVHTVEVNSHRVVEGFSVQDILCILEGLCNDRILMWKLDILEGQRLGLVDEGPVTKDDAWVYWHAGPAIGFDFLLAHDVEKFVWVE